MAIKDLEQISGTLALDAICHNPSCQKDYSSKERSGQTSGLPEPNTAVKYCCDSCWFEETAYEDNYVS